MRLGKICRAVYDETTTLPNQELEREDVFVKYNFSNDIHKFVFILFVSIFIRVN